MVAYNWGIDQLKAPLPVDGQTWVDPSFNVWAYDAAASAWSRAPHLTFRKTHSRPFYTAGTLAGGDIFVSTRRTGRFRWFWDQLLDLSYVEVLDLSSGAVLGRRAGMTKAALAAWLGTVVPSSGGNYDDHIMLNVYEVVDPRQWLDKWNAWNGLYGSFRGRDCYINGAGYGRSALVPSLGGAAPNFESWHTTIGGVAGRKLEEALMNWWYGMVPGVQETRFCWASHNKRNLYHLPKQTGVITNVASNFPGRYCWDWGSSDWNQAPFGQYEVVTAGLTNPNPCILRRDTDSHQITLHTPQEAFRGQCGIFGVNNSSSEYMLAYLVRSSANPDMVGAVIKPYGVTKAAFVLPPSYSAANYDLIAVGKHNDSPCDPKYAKLSAPLIEYRGNGDGIRITDLGHMMIQVSRAMTGQARNRSHDDPNLAERVHFYLRHKVTGVRTEESIPHLRVNRRRCGMPLAMTFRNG